MTLWNKWYIQIYEKYKHLPYEEANEKVHEERRTAVNNIVSKSMCDVGDMAFMAENLEAVVYDAVINAVLYGYSSEEEYSLLNGARNKLFEANQLLEKLVVMENKRHKKEWRGDV